ncbi:MAG: T9SS type A sorting domain-containing protein [Bacteroidales bacterium]
MKKILLTSLIAVIVFSGNYIYGQQQVPNSGFELWEEFGFGPDTLEPVNWNSLKSSDGGDLINGVIPVTLERSEDAHSGMYSAKLTNDTILIFVAPGAMTNGRVHATLPPTDAYVYTVDSLPEFHTPFSDFPDSLTLWAKYFPTDNDIARITAILHTDTAKIADSLQTNWVAVAYLNIEGEVDEWTRFSVPFEYLTSDTPEYILFAMFAGDAANALPQSTLYIDDLELIYYNTGIFKKQSDFCHLFMDGEYLHLILDQEYMQDEYLLQVYDLSGRVMFSKRIIPALEHKIRLDIHKGIYLVKIHNGQCIRTRKIIVN